MKIYIYKFGKKEYFVLEKKKNINEFFLSC